MYVIHLLSFYTVKTTDVTDVLKSLPVSHAILPRVMCFTTSRPANHAICSFIDSDGYASGPIRRCLFIDYIINENIYMQYIFPHCLRKHDIKDVVAQ